MARGTINGTTGNQYIDAKIEWASTPFTDKNQSYVTARLYYKRNNDGYTTSGTGTFSVAINGVKTTTTKHVTISEDGWVKVAEAGEWVSHATDGTKSIIISASGSIPGTSLNYTSVSGTAVLYTIQRASVISSVGGNLGASCKVKWTPHSTSFRYKIQFQIGDWSHTTEAIHPNTTTEYTYTGYKYPYEVAEQIEPNSREGVMTATLYTYWDSSCKNQLGVPSSKDFGIMIYDSHDELLPTVVMELSPVTSLGSPFDKLYIQGRTKVCADFTVSEGKYGANISTRTMKVGDMTVGSGNSVFETPYLSTAGEVTVSGWVKDSRGLTSKTIEKTITVSPYASPKILPASGENAIVCARCDKDGNLSESGTYLKIKAMRSYSKVFSGRVQNNFCHIRYRYKAEGDSYSPWATILASDSASDEVETNALLDGALLTTSSYSVQVGVIDDVGESYSLTFRIPTDRIYMHRAGSMNSLGIGKYAEEENVVDIAEDITTQFRGNVKFMGEAWLSLGLSENVAESKTAVGRRGDTGCHYRVCAGGKHIYVAFNCAFEYFHIQGMKQVNAELLPPACSPDRNMYAMCAVECKSEKRAIARVIVTPLGEVLIDWVQNLTDTDNTPWAEITWIDGYIDYWI